MSTRMRPRKTPTDPEVVRRMRSSGRYQRWRSAILRNEPLCRSCAEAGFTVAAEHIDHIEPAHLVPERFRNRDNVQLICRDCHESKTASVPRRCPSTPNENSLPTSFVGRVL